MSQQFDRFKDAPWFRERTETVLVGGAGGIGSWLVFFLTKAGFKPIVYDYDRIEEHNLGGQLFRPESVGHLKVDALYDMIKEFCNEEISVVDTPFDENSATHYFMFSAFDNMKARKDFFNVWKKSIENCPVTPILIDGRLLMEQLQIFSVTPENMQQYEEKYLFDDSEAEGGPCTLKQTSHSAAMIASHMVGMFTNHITNIYEREIIRDVPFYFEHFIPMTLTITK